VYSTGGRIVETGSVEERGALEKGCVEERE
jgi:hypothetical protein